MIENKEKFIVYVHITPNNKYYIGTTRTSVDVRWKNGYGYKNNTHFWNAIQKYGWDNIKHQWWYVDTEEEMYRQEIELIAKYQTNNPDYGYNKSLGGEKSGWMGKNAGTPEYMAEHYLKNQKAILEKNKQYNAAHKTERAEYMKQYYDTHKDEIAEYMKQYYDTHKDEIAEYGKQYNATHKDERAEYGKQYNATHKAEKGKYMKQYYATHKDERAEYGKQYRDTHKDEIAEYKKQYNAANKEAINARRRLRRLKKKQEKLLNQIPINFIQLEIPFAS